MPDKAPSATKVAQDFKAGKYPGKKKEPEKSKAIIEGLGNCYYPMIDSLDAPPASGHCERWVEGSYIAFGFVESPPGHAEQAASAAHETFVYVICGALDAIVGKQKKRVAAGGVIHVPKSSAYRWVVTKGNSVRYAAVRSLASLEAAIGKHGAADNWRG